MVHPYLRRRQGLENYEKVKGPLAGVLDRTLGVPLFQEQVMELAIHGADFSPGEADQLRRSMAAWERRGDLEHFLYARAAGWKVREKWFTRAEFAERVFNARKSRSRDLLRMAFPESHSASFALLASCKLLAQVPRAGDVCGGPAQFAATRVLHPGANHPGPARSWRAGASDRCALQRLGRDA